VVIFLVLDFFHASFFCVDLSAICCFDVYILHFYFLMYIVAASVNISHVGICISNYSVLLSKSQ
jgi:hypothetical protein